MKLLKINLDYPNTVYLQGFLLIANVYYTLILAHADLSSAIIRHFLRWQYNIAKYEAEASIVLNLETSLFRTTRIPSIIKYLHSGSFGSAKSVFRWIISTSSYHKKIIIIGSTPELKSSKSRVKEMLNMNTNHPQIITDLFNLSINVENLMKQRWNKRLKTGYLYKHRA